MIPIRLLAQDDQDLIGFARKNLQEQVCLSPFTTIEVDIQGHVRLCECGAWMPSTVGNLFEKSLDEILSNRHSVAIRRSISDGSYEFCDENKCGVLLNNQLVSREQIASKHRIILDDPEQWIMPHIIRVAGDLTCNLSCPSCRTKIIKIDDEQRERQRDLGKLLQKNLFARSSNDHIILHVSTSGEIFASPLLMEFVNNISIDQFPNLELCIQTNGLLAEKNWHQLGSMQQRVGMITVTTDAATKTTYEKLRRGGKWTHCQKALAWISEKKQANGMKLVMRMVVQKQNYQEIKQFYDQACLLRADLVEYSRLSNWGTWTGEQFIEHDVFNPAHEEYHLAQKALDEIKRLPNIFLCGGIS